MPSSLPLRRAVTEFFVIAAGVLAGLAADEWRQDRQDATLAVSYIERLAADLRVDSARWANLQDGLLRKQRALDRVILWLEAPSPDLGSAQQLAEDITSGATLAYSAATQAERTTFDDLVNTGRLQLIEKTSLRSALQAYYARVDLQARRLEARVTRYAPLAYELVPRDPEFEVLSRLSQEDLIRIAERAWASDLLGPAIAERNRGRLRMGIADGLVGDVTSVLAEITTER